MLLVCRQHDLTPRLAINVGKLNLIQLLEATSVVIAEDQEEVLEFTEKVDQVLVFIDRHVPGSSSSLQLSLANILELIAFNLVVVDGITAKVNNPDNVSQADDPHGGCE